MKSGLAGSDARNEIGKRHDFTAINLSSLSFFFLFLLNSSENRDDPAVRMSRFPLIRQKRDASQRNRCGWEIVTFFLY